MALEGNEGGGMVMPVAPFYGNGNGNGFGGDWAWIILLLLLGWGNNGWGGNGGLGGGGLYPWMNQSNQISEGFQNQLMNDNITSIRDNVFGLSSQFADCCCENRLATADLKYTIATEECATRNAANMNARDIIDSQTRASQAILDKLCQLELDGVKAQVEAKNERIAELTTQLTMANLAASQTAQTSRILADNAAQTVALEQYLNPVPVPAYVVQNPNCCAQNAGCGCGCGGF